MTGKYKKIAKPFYIIIIIIITIETLSVLDFLAISVQAREA